MVICGMIPLEPFVILRSVDRFLPFKITGIPIYKAINPGRAPNLLKAIKYVCNNCLRYSIGTTFEDKVSYAAHMISLGLFSTLDIIFAFFFILMANLRRFVETMATSSRFSSVPISTPLGFAGLFMTLELNRSTSSKVHLQF